MNTAPFMRACTAFRRGACLILLLAAGCYVNTGPAEALTTAEAAESKPPATPSSLPHATAEKPGNEQRATGLCASGKTDTRAMVQGKHRPEPRARALPPRKGEWYADPEYGSCVVRLTDHENEPPEGFARNDYSRRQPFNADDSRVLVYAQNGYWHLYDPRTLKYVRKLDLGGGGVEPHWHPRDPDLLYVLPNNGGMRLDLFDTRTGARKTIADFTQDLVIAGYPEAESLRDIWPEAARVFTRSEGSPSMDARFWAFQVETDDFKSLGLIGYDAQEHRVTGVYDLARDGNGNGVGRPDHISMSPKGNYIVASWNGDEVDCPSRFRLGTLEEPCGLMAFTRNFDDARGLAARGPHSDIAIDAKGREVIVISNYISGDVEMIALDDGDVTTLWEIYDDGYSTAMHISGKAYGRPGWVLISTYGLTGKGGYTPWYTDKLMAVELSDNPRILNIANMLNRRTGYFSEPHAAVNRDFTRIVYNSNWGTGKDTDIDVYLVKLPRSALLSK